MPVAYKKTATSAEQQIWIAKSIKTLLDKNTEPSEIAIIARKHSTLKKIVKVLENFEVPTFYEKGQNVFEQKPIAQLIILMEFLVLNLEVDKSQSEVLIPQILSFEFWEIARPDIWKLSLDVYKYNLGKMLNEKKTWLEIMLTYSPDTKIYQIADFLINLSVEAKSEPGEKILDHLMGITEQEIENQIEEME